MDARTALGNAGELIAAQYLHERGFVIVERNWRCRAGEIDIVAKLGRCFVFVEVKTRRSSRFGHPLEAITPTKASRLRALARTWMEAKAAVGSIRIDAVGVLMVDGRVERLDHVEAIA